MLIINGGIPRSGTVLVGNLVRLMLERRGVAWHRYNPQERRNLPDFLKLTLQSFEGTVIVHTHLIDGEIMSALHKRQDAVLFWNHRDPRDALVSLMQLHEMTLDHGLQAMQIYCAATEIAHTSQRCHKIAYEALRDDVPEHIQSIATALGFDLEPGEIDDLTHQTSASAHARVMKNLQAGTTQEAREIQTKRRRMREDPTTLVNDRHIQSGKSGRWLQELSAEEQRRATIGLKRWIRLLGYA